MTDAALNLWRAAGAFAVEAMREPWAAVAVGAFVLGLMLDRSRAVPLVQVGRAVLGAVVAYGIIRLLQEVMR